MITVGFKSGDLLYATFKDENYFTEDRIFIDGKTAWVPKNILKFKNADEAKRFLFINDIKSEYVKIEPITILQKIIKYYERDNNYCELFKEVKYKEKNNV